MDTKLCDLLSSCDDFDTMNGIELTNEKKVRDTFSYTNDETVEEIVEIVETYLNNGYQVYEKDIGNYNEMLVEILENLENEDNFKIIHRED